MAIRAIILLALVLGSHAADTTTARTTRYTSRDSARVVSPRPGTNIDGDVVLKVEPDCPVVSVSLLATTYYQKTDTLATVSNPPYSVPWSSKGLPDHDQLSLKFGYILYHPNGDTIHSGPLAHRWIIDRRNAHSPKRATCRQLSIGRTITIDDDASDWWGIRRISLGKMAHFSVTWTPVAFKLLARIRDPNITPGDRLELSFDMRSTRESFADSDHRLLTFGPASRSFATVVALTDSGPSYIDSLIVRIGDEMEWRSSLLPDGYLVEVSIPFRVLTDLEFPPSSFGFDIAVQDQNEASARAPSVVTWSGALPSNRHNPSEWGTIDLRQVMFPLKLTLVTLVGILAGLILLILGLNARQKQHERRYLKQTQQKYSELVSGALEAIEQSCGNPNLHISAIARRIQSKPEALEKSLISETGAGFGHLLEMARIRRARQLLRDTDSDPRAIGAQCGFAENGSFEKAFKKLAGVSPLAYRRGQKEDQQEEIEEEKA